MVQPACDPNNLPLTNPFSFGTGHGPYTMRHNCFFGKPLMDGAFNYTEQFFDTYKGKRKYFTLRIINPHEMSGELAGEVDPYLSSFLKSMDKKGHLDNTIVHIYSDHGDHISPLGHFTVSGKREKMNPFYFLMLPKDLREKYEPMIRKNQQKLITHYDFFVTDLRYLKFKKIYKTHGGDIFGEELNGERTCDSEHVEESCQCLPKEY